MLYRSIIFLLLLAGTSVTRSQNIAVAVAASVKPVIDELTMWFDLKTDNKVSVISGSSGNLTTQILNGAPYDLFLSADTHYCRVLFDKNAALTEPKIYAYGKLILLSHHQIDSARGMNVLLEPWIRKIAIANPQIAPYGAAAVEALRYYQLYDTLKSKFVFGESIAQANQFLSTGSAEISITSASAAIQDSTNGKTYPYSVDAKAYKPISHAMVILHHGKDNPAVKKFYEFISSDKAKEIFQKYGFALP